MRSAGSSLALSVTCGDRFPLLSLRDIFPRRGGSLSSKGEPLAKPHTLHLNRKLCRHAKASPFGRGGFAKQRRRGLGRSPKSCRFLSKSLPMKIHLPGALPFTAQAPRENAMPGGPQTARHCSIQIIFPLKMRRATRRAFQIVLAIAASAHHLTAGWLFRSDCGCDAPASPPQRYSRRRWGR